MRMLFWWLFDPVVEGGHEVVDLRNAECDSAAYVELNASAQGLPAPVEMVLWV